MPNYSAMMGDRDLPTNEYLSSDRAQEDDNDLFAAIGKQVLSLSLNNEEVIDDDERVKVVDEVEGICMNCFEDVSTRTLPAYCILIHIRVASLAFFLQRSPTSAKLS